MSTQYIGWCTKCAFSAAEKAKKAATKQMKASNKIYAQASKAFAANSTLSHQRSMAAAGCEQAEATLAHAKSVYEKAKKEK
ncbi:uncharacterized protein I303_103188 [Kwoniella dejecticola CBS 10117]|uniref:Uncharacterized protein n=1 Tax=Kwoniella dejecticola CBS 10117 TaxID=1296121 RepID=A0A1A6AAU0_9TREE|nr:uncharacterized protein I303_03211 [Kwoniella dejecticola CBS 10117]OBR87187.1 hypothetical protein I303_03211 [Kwoniella dejecticola CBS 10117]